MNVVSAFRRTLRASPQLSQTYRPFIYRSLTTSVVARPVDQLSLAGM
jgi:hypothetical protein